MRPKDMPLFTFDDLSMDTFQATIELDDGYWDVHYLTDPLRTALVRVRMAGIDVRTQLPGHMPVHVVQFYLQKTPCDGEAVH